MKKVKHSKRKLPTFTRQLECPICNRKWGKQWDILEHYKNEHGIPIETQSLQFVNEKEFRKWKINIEKEQQCQYVIRKSKYFSKKDGTSKIIYRCHRDGYFHSGSKNIRHEKILGTNKINGYCPSKINVAIYETGQVIVIYCSSHVGHQGELGRVRLSHFEKDKIAEKIAMRMPFDQILNDVRLSSFNMDIERIHLLTRKDLFNIVRKYNLKYEGVFNKNDRKSFESWIKEMERLGGVIRFYKAQDISSVSNPELSKEDFVLVIMNEAQKEILQQYSNNFICLDNVHGLDKRGFELATLIIVDDKCQGFPCAFMFSNRSDIVVMKLFFSCIKDAMSKTLRPKVFMSDMTQTFYSAWLEVMEPPKFRLFCDWHVDQAWRKNLNKITNIEKRAQVYKQIRTLIEESDKIAFSRMLEKEINYLKKESETKEFGLYFELNYKDCAVSWAYCHRLQVGKNTNMDLERMHRVIKHIYMGGNKPKKLHVTIRTLMRFVRDKLYDRLIYLHKGKVSRKLALLRQRHLKSLTISTEGVICENGVWKVPSKNVNEFYEIRKTEQNNCKCDMRCTDCNLCIHTYICTCHDSAIKFNMCKHIHIIGMHTVAAGNEENIDEGELSIRGVSTHEENEDEEGELSIHDVSVLDEQEIIVKQVTNLKEKNPNKYLQQSKEELHHEFINVLSEIKTSAHIEIVRKQLQSMIPCIRAEKRNSKNVDDLVIPLKMPKKLPQRKFILTQKFKT